MVKDLHITYKVDNFSVLDPKEYPWAFSPPGTTWVYMKKTFLVRVNGSNPSTEEVMDSFVFVSLSPTRILILQPKFALKVNESKKFVPVHPRDISPVKSAWRLHVWEPLTESWRTVKESTVSSLTTDGTVL